MECGELWKRCHSPSEVRTIQDTHIQARITQFRDNREGIDVFKCPVVEEYIDSGRADQIDQSTEGSCSLAEVSLQAKYMPYITRVALFLKKLLDLAGSGVYFGYCGGQKCPKEL